MEQQKIVLYTMFVEFFGKQTKLQKLCCTYTLGFWHFQEPNGTTKTCLIYLFFWGVWGKSTNFKAWVQVMKDSTWNKETRSKMGCEWTLSVVCFHNKLTLIQSHLKFMSQTCCSKEGCWNSDILSVFCYTNLTKLFYFIFCTVKLSWTHMTICHFCVGSIKEKARNT